jgi:nucleoside-diphosphate-sugar epimerase
MRSTETVLVTGGAGFIGSNLADGLIASGAKVRIIDNFLTGYRENLDEIRGDFDFVEGDINDPAAISKAMSGVSLVFHQAALPSVPRSVANPGETHQACVNGTFSVLSAAREAGVKRVVYAASSSAYGDQPVSPKVETMRPDPLSPYAVAKLVGEYYSQVFFRSYGLETICLRYFNVFGPRQDPTSQYSGVISRFVDALAKGNRPVIYGNGEQTRDFTFVANVVNANIRASQTTKGIGKVMNVANGEAISLNELLGVLKGIFERSDIEAVYEPARTGDILHSLANNSLAKECIGYEKLIGLEDGLSKTLDWWKKSRFAL